MNAIPSVMTAVGTSPSEGSCENTFILSSRIDISTLLLIFVNYHFYARGRGHRGQIIGPCLRNCLFGIADPGVHRVGRSIAFFCFFYKKKLEVSASNPFEMQAKLYAELTDDIFRYYSVPKNSLGNIHSFDPRVN